DFDGTVFFQAEDGIRGFHVTGVQTCALPIFAAAAAGNAAAQSLEPLKVRLDWTPWGVHGAIHLAQQKGWFKEAGLAPSIEDGNRSEERRVGKVREHGTMTYQAKDRHLLIMTV